jgi:L-lactate dehydrogenase complex protein LldG
MLGRIAAALGDVPPGEPVDRPGARPVPAAEVGSPRLVELFAERAADYRAGVTTCAADGVAAAVSDLCRRHGATRVVTPAGLPAEWVPAAVERVVDDPPVTVDLLDAVDGVVTGAAVAVAATGTLILDGGPICGRRAITLVPDLHICVVRAQDVVADVPEALSAVRPAVDDGRPLTLVSGPSATSDIELDRVEGVHGPRRLELVLVVAS